MIVTGSSAETIEKAVQLIRTGELIGLPTETVYGLGANAMDDHAVAKIYALKGRPINHPLIAHVYSKDEVRYFSDHVPIFAHHLMDTLWPGPLTLILQKRVDIANACSANLQTIAIRCPKHEVAQSLLQRCRQVNVWGLAAPSANRFGRVSPTTAKHVQEEFGESLFILDGGACDVGIESTIIDCTRGRPVVLRPGILTLKELSICAKEPVVAEHDLIKNSSEKQGRLKAPNASGTLDSHYAPRALVRLLTQAEIQQRLTVESTYSLKLGLWSQPLKLLTNTVYPVFWEQIPSKPIDCAKVLFAQLRAFDGLGVDEIWVEKPQNSPEWAGINDRLQRAAHTGTEHR